MKNIYSVVVLLNGDVWGSWTLEHKPSLEERTKLRWVIATATTAENKFSVYFSDNLDCDSFADVLSGIQESLVNEDYIE